MLYIENGLKQKWLANIFATFCILASFGMGNMTQANSISNAFESTLKIPAYITGVVLAVIVALVIIGGIGRIGKVTERIVPFMAISYVCGGLIIIFINISNVPSAFQMIFEGAFSFKSVGGGIMGYTISQAIRYGVARGVFSNEAGLGSAVMVNAASNVKEPVRQGMWGMLEVFVDTIVVCTITALTILCTGAHTTGKKGVELTIEAFSHGFSENGAGLFVSISITLFAFATIIGWSYYGQRAVEYLFGQRYIGMYKLIYILVIIVGCTVSLKLVWNISDTFNGLMAIPNLIAVVLLSNKVMLSLKDYLKRSKDGTLETKPFLKVSDMKSKHYK